MFLYSLPFSLYFSPKCCLAQGLPRVRIGGNWMGLHKQIYVKTGASKAWAEK